MWKFLVVCALAIAGCGDHTAVVADSNITFVALPIMFQPFRAWTSFHSDGPVDDGTYPVDVLGPRTQYINTPPPHGATEFPIGTMIVEARESGTMHILASVKRGGGFNADGAVDWEWFQLSEDPGSGAVGILWRGTGPPSGTSYGANTGPDCSACHISCGSHNDEVCSPKLQLAGF